MNTACSRLSSVACGLGKSGVVPLHAAMCKVHSFPFAFSLGQFQGLLRETQPQTPKPWTLFIPARQVFSLGQFLVATPTRTRTRCIRPKTHCLYGLAGSSSSVQGLPS
jgi:hypothetical protein